jgi:hypothetical protein
MDTNLLHHRRLLQARQIRAEHRGFALVCLPFWRVPSLSSWRCHSQQRWGRVRTLIEHCAVDGVYSPRMHHPAPPTGWNDDPCRASSTEPCMNDPHGGSTLAASAGRSTPQYPFTIVWHFAARVGRYDTLEIRESHPQPRQANKIHPHTSHPWKLNQCLPSSPTDHVPGRFDAVWTLVCAAVQRRG